MSVPTDHIPDSRLLLLRGSRLRARWVLFFLVVSSLLPLAVPGPGRAAGEASAELSADQLWAKAEAALGASSHMEAAILFQRFQQQYPESAQAEEALWLAAKQAKEHAETGRDPHWKYVRDLFKRYTIDYPQSPRYREAYFELGQAYHQMHLYREALIYFNLFLKRFPKSPLVPHVRYWQAKTFLEVGRLDEATAVFEELSKSADPVLRLRGFVGRGDALYAGKQYLAALAAYKRVQAKAPRHYLDDPSFLFKMGKTYFKVGNEGQGRKYLFHFLNLDTSSRQRAEAMFEIGESYYRGSDTDAAQELYEMVVKEGAADQRAVVLSRFRQAQYRDDPDRVIPEWSKPPDLTDPAGDQPYLAVLTSFYREPIAQEARLGLIRRYQARKDDQRFFELAVNFIQQAPDDVQRRKVETEVGDILVRWVQERLDNHKYQEVYDLYRAEYRHIKAYGNGRLLYLIGQAFESLTLYDQAAVIYYRALGLPLTPAEKIDLYYRRARVYLALKDWASANRLLTYLRKLYKDDPAVGEIYYLSGRMLEAQGKHTAEALGYYEQAVAKPSLTEHRPLYAAAALNMMFRLGRPAPARTLLAKVIKEGWFDADRIQEWYGRLGGSLRQGGELLGALAAYRAALGEGLPTEGPTVQSLQLRMGETLAELGQRDEAVALFEKARSGSDPLTSKVAQERLNQLAINSAMSVVGEPAGGQ